MRVRALKESDVPILRTMAQSSGFPYPEADAPHLKAVLVVVDDEDNPIMAAAAEPIYQAYLWCPRASRSTHLIMAGLRLLHEEMPHALKGIVELNAFIPPKLAVQFGRRLKRSFGWEPNWPSWFKRF